MKYNCQTCGVCCQAKVRLNNFDIENIESQLHENGFMKQFPGGRCLAFRGFVRDSCSCSIYETRPEVCRKVTCDDSFCNVMRKLYGMDIVGKMSTAVLMDVTNAILRK
jgi:Fe-S-cluster containining protein